MNPTVFNTYDVNRKYPQTLTPNFTSDGSGRARKNVTDIHAQQYTTPYSRTVHCPPPCPSHFPFPPSGEGSRWQEGLGTWLDGKVWCRTPPPTNQHTARELSFGAESFEEKSFDMDIAAPGEEKKREGGPTNHDDRMMAGRGGVPTLHRVSGFLVQLWLGRGWHGMSPREGQQHPTGMGLGLGRPHSAGYGRRPIMPPAASARLPGSVAQGEEAPNPILSPQPPWFHIAQQWQ